MTNQPFKVQLSPLIEAVGGVQPAAKVCGVTRQTLYRWLRGDETPKLAMQAGVLLLLTKAVPVNLPEPQGANAGGVP